MYSRELCIGVEKALREPTSAGDEGIGGVEQTSVCVGFGSSEGQIVKEIKYWIRDFKSGRISRRDFVERAATGGLSLLATTSILSAKVHAEGHGGEINHQHSHGHDH